MSIQNEDLPETTPILNYQQDETSARRTLSSYLDDGHKTCPTCKGTGKVAKSKAHFETLSLSCI